MCNRPRSFQCIIERPQRYSTAEQSFRTIDIFVVARSNLEAGMLLLPKLLEGDKCTNVIDTQERVYDHHTPIGKPLTANTVMAAFQRAMA